jgi:hypothetical protein
MTQMQANEKAPAYAMQEAYINAPIQTVWGILADFAKWPKWNDSVKEMHFQGEVEVGKEFRWNASGMKIRSRIEELNSPLRIVWSGRTMGIRAIHSWAFAVEKNGTKVRSEESFEGLVVVLFAKQMKKALDNALDQGISALKKEAEKRNREVVA